jgi:hypothetical protein
MSLRWACRNALEAGPLRREREADDACAARREPELAAYRAAQRAELARLHDAATWRELAGA